MCGCDRTSRFVCGHCRAHRLGLAPWQREVIEAERKAEAETPTDPAARVIDDMGREWALKTNGTLAALGEALTVDSFTVLADRYGVSEVLS